MASCLTYICTSEVIAALVGSCKMLHLSVRTLTEICWFGSEASISVDFPSVPDNRWMCDWGYYSAAVVGSQLFAIELSKYIVGSKFHVLYLLNKGELNP